MDTDAAIVIRDATPADLSFLVASARAMALETEAKPLTEAVVTAGVAGLLARTERGFYLVAEQTRQSVGTLMVTYEWSDWRNGDFWWIQSVYVTADARRGGVFRALYAEPARRARAAGAVGLRLYVEQDNVRAQATYAALGMQRTHYALYETLF
ncbi:MAG TPA: GNAT family N-acetyltransferase [Rhodanobacteraceae bacterium]|nr:GNAT family N-acetyltransferase [Rhodanobacteraceae bacterium]